MKLKTIRIKRSQYGDLYGLVNGRTKYQSSTDTINIGKLRGQVLLQVEQETPKAINVTSNSESFLSTIEGVTGEFSSGNMAFPYFPNLKTNFIIVAHFVKNYWDKGLTIGTTIFEVLKQLNILAISSTKFYRL